MSKYHAPFIVILWDVHTRGDADAKWLREKLQEANIPTLILSALIPQLRSDVYYIRGDSHPTAAAYELVAKTLAQFIARRFPSIQELTKH